MRWRSTGSPERDTARVVRALTKDYQRAYKAGDAVEAERLATRVVEIDPTAHPMWFDLGLFAKRRRDWPAAVRLNQRALELTEGEPENPAAWNLGIAATALDAWDLARTAWRAYGMRKLPEGPGPIVADLGLTPVRLNPPLRHLGDQLLELDGEVHAIEVVWCRRLCPARAEIISVPTPETGHRHGDVVLHDGEPVGTRYLDGSPRSVFNEVERLVASPTPTTTLEIECPSRADWEDLMRQLDHMGVVAEDWTASMAMLCVACSEGDPGPHHRHEPDAEWRPNRRIGCAARAAAVESGASYWARGAADRTVVDVRGPR